ncbi:MAG: DNA-binding protein WhiA [Eubacterium sp.]
MSFSSEIKKDLSSLESETKGCKRAELSGIIASTALITVDENGEMVFTVKTENPAVAGRIFKLIKDLYQTASKVVIKKTKKFKEHRSYSVELSENEKVQRMLKDTRILKHNTKGQVFFTNEVPGFFISKQRYVKAYVRGVFIACGSISNPEKTYHLELVSKQKGYLKSIQEFLKHYDIKANFIQRKSSYVLYMKESESVAGFLNVIGAHKALLEIENIRIVKEVRNDVNRQVNCEMANMDKTMTAAYEQIHDILYIKEKIGLQKLTRNLYEMAEVRLNYRDLTIKELGEKMDPPVGKSGVYHRLKKLNQLAENLRNEE